MIILRTLNWQVVVSNFLILPTDLRLSMFSLYSFINHELIVIFSNVWVEWYSVFWQLPVFFTACICFSSWLRLESNEPDLAFFLVSLVRLVRLYNRALLTWREKSSTSETSKPSPPSSKGYSSERILCKLHWASNYSTSLAGNGGNFFAGKYQAHADA